MKEQTRLLLQMFLPKANLDWQMEPAVTLAPAAELWARIHTLYIGEKLGLGVLLAVVLIGAAAAFSRLFAGEFDWPKPRSAVRTPRRKMGSGLKALALLLLALLPGGLMGTFAVYTIMGRENWRRDALAIFAAALIPAWLLFGLRAERFPWPELRDAIYVSGLLGLIFGLLQIWALLKLLRQWWGEPEECVPWWPPAVLLLQTLLLAACSARLLLS